MNMIAIIYILIVLLSLYRIYDCLTNKNLGSFYSNKKLGIIINNQPKLRQINKLIQLFIYSLLIIIIIIIIGLGSLVNNTFITYLFIPMIISLVLEVLLEKYAFKLNEENKPL